MSVDKPVVEEKPSGDEVEVTLAALNRRVRQQEILSELGVGALQGKSLDELFYETARLVAEGLNAEFCKVLEYLPNESVLVVRAGVGWNEGVVGKAKIGADYQSPAGFALQSGKPLISNHLENEERFRTPELLREHGIKRAMNVILQGEGKPFGVLEVDSRSDDDFIEQDIAFLQGAANLVGMAIDRERKETLLRQALERQHMLLKEMNHRVKNSLATVAGLLRLQKAGTGDDALVEHLNKASDRIEAIARVHGLLYKGNEFERLDIGRYIEALCRELGEGSGNCTIITNCEKDILVSTDKAISCALMVNELLTNAIKYAYPDGNGTIWVSLTCEEKPDVTISVRDEGRAMPIDFDVNRVGGLGTRILNAFSKQLGGTFEVKHHSKGKEFIVKVPMG